MIKKHTEQRFEDAIVAELIKDGGCAFVNYNHKSGKSYVAGEEKGDFDRARARCGPYEVRDFSITPGSRDFETPESRVANGK